MILRIILRNFLSFDGEMQFDMFPNMKRTQLASHVYTDIGGVPILKQAAIYGANGAGKSNLIKALEFLRTFVVKKDFIRSIELDKYFYLLKKDPTEEPIYIAIEFAYQKKFYFYEIEIGLKAVVCESLSETFPTEERSELVFERKKNKVEYAKGVVVDDAIVSATQNMLTKNPMSSLLALNNEFPIIQDVRCKNVSRWFRAQLEIIGVHSFLPNLINILRTNKPMMEFARKLVYRLELGICDFTMVESDFELWAKKHIELADKLPRNIENLELLSPNANNTPVFSINIENGVRKVYQLMFDNMGKNGFIGHLDASSQSDGTLRALTLLPALYYASKQGKTVVVDEINYCLSPTMVKGFVEFFAKTNDTNGQLIFTTHDTQLLEEKEILRSDEIWFVDKHEGASLIYSHNDFKEHRTISTLRGYNEGRYGAIRFVNLLLEDGK